MLPFFRKIRYRLAEDNELLKYSRYAIGEIVLVVIGILIALQINTWNEERKERRTITKLYQNLEANLKTDSLALQEIIMRTDKSLSNINMLLSTSNEELLAKNSNDELLAMSRHIFQGVYSFYPKKGVYNQIVSSNLMNLIESDQIKDALVLYYDFRCKRYESFDPIMDQKYHFQLSRFIGEDLKITIFDHFDDSDAAVFTDQTLEGLKSEVRQLYDMTYVTLDLLKELENDINTLLKLIDYELKTS